jgi:hypothetical protein
MSATPVIARPVTVPLLAPDGGEISLADVVGDPPADHHEVGSQTSYAQPPVASKPYHWRARSTGHWKAIGELYLEILTKLHRQRGLPLPNQAAAIVRMRADAKHRARAMFGDNNAKT